MIPKETETKTSPSASYTCYVFNSHQTRKIDKQPAVCLSISPLSPNCMQTGPTQPLRMNHSIFRFPPTHAESKTLRPQFAVPTRSYIIPSRPSFFRLHGTHPYRDAVLLLARGKLNDELRSGPFLAIVQRPETAHHLDAILGWNFSIARHFSAALLLTLSLTYRSLFYDASPMSHSLVREPSIPLFRRGSGFFFFCSLREENFLPSDFFFFFVDNTLFSSKLTKRKTNFPWTFQHEEHTNLKPGVKSIGGHSSH